MSDGCSEWSALSTLVMRSLSLRVAPRVSRIADDGVEVAWRDRDDSVSFVFREPGSGKPYYRASGGLECSYRGAMHTEAVSRLIDPLCALVAEHPGPIAAALRAEGPSPESASTTTRRLPLVPVASEAHPHEQPRGDAWEPLPTEALAAVGAVLALDAADIVSLRITHDRTDVELGLRSRGTPIGLVVGAIGRHRNPFLAGAKLVVTLASYGDALLAGGLVASLAKRVLEHEDALIAALSPYGKGWPAGLPSANAGMTFPVGRPFHFTGRRGDGLRAVSQGDASAMLFVDSPCFGNCVFCGEGATTAHTLSDPDALVREVSALPASVKSLAIVGSEPLSHPGILEVIAEARRAGIAEVELMTSGIPLGSTSVTSALMAAGLTSVVVPLYSHVAEMHDLLVRVHGAFDKTVRGLDALAAAGCAIHLHSVILRQNCDDIDPLSDLARDRWGASFVAAPPRAKRDFANVTPLYAELSKRIARATVLSVPYCLLPRMTEHPSVDAAAPIHQTLGPGYGAMVHYFLLMEGLEHKSACTDCAWNRSCCGIVREQLAVEPGLTLTPFARTR